ncbi:WD40-repeat-containing domain protein [Lipomyces oligophaga]|uniref:WD40-repeat-containing domain protein n=1 Tax=Lipomyces oligophaga TaxID=45792 RepID=UPI0034CED130
MDNLTEYEKQRQENIARNQALLRDLELRDLGASVSGSARINVKPAGSRSSTANSNSHNRNKKKRSHDSAESKPSSTATPRRVSARLAGIKAEDSAALEKLELHNEQAKRKEEQARMRISGTMKFEDISSDRISSFWTFDDDDTLLTGKSETQDQELTARPVLEDDIVRLRKDLSSLSLYDRWVPNQIKITPERVFYLNFHPSPSRKLILAGDKAGNLGVWDADSQRPAAGPTKAEDEDEEEQDPQLYLFKVHARTLSYFTFNPDSTTEKLYTASYDGSVRCVDFRSGTSSEVFYGGDGVSESGGISEIKFADTNVFYYSTLDGECGRVDIRAKPSSATEIFRLHEKKIGGMALHPNAPHLAATSSLDRTMKLWDFRQISTLPESGERQPALLAEYSSRLSVSCVSWNTAGDIVCNGYDDTINIFNLPDSSTWSVPSADSPVRELVPKTRIPHNCQTGKWVTILRAHWQPRPADGIQKFVIGNMKKFFDVYTADGVQLARLGDSARVTTVPAACNFHPTQNWIAGGTASGKVCLYT